MLDINLVNRKVELEQQVLDLKLWLAQKEDLGYNDFISKPENEKFVKSAKDKVIAQIKMADENWLNKELELFELEKDLKIVKSRYDILVETLRCVTNPNSGVTIGMFLEYQDNFISNLLS